MLGEKPGWWDLGAVGIVAGLLLIVKDRADADGTGKVRHIISLSKIAKPERV